MRIIEGLKQFVHGLSEVAAEIGAFGGRVITWIKELLLGSTTNKANEVARDRLGEEATSQDDDAQTTLSTSGELQYGGKLDVDGCIDVPGDGNCLFHSLDKALQIISGRDKPIGTHVLREAAASWLEEKLSESNTDTEIKDQIMAAMIASFNEEKMAKIESLEVERASWMEQLVEENENLEAMLAADAVDASSISSDESDDELTEDIADVKSRISQLSERIKQNDIALAQLNNQRFHPDTYIATVRRDREFGKTVECMALAEAYNITLKVRRSINDTHQQQFGNGKPIVHILNKNNHFKVFIPEERPANETISELTTLQKQQDLLVEHIKVAKSSYEQIEKKLKEIKGGSYDNLHTSNKEELIKQLEEQIDDFGEMINAYATRIAANEPRLRELKRQAEAKPTDRD